MGEPAHSYVGSPTGLLDDYYEQPDENAKSLKDRISVVFRAIYFFY